MEDEFESSVVLGGSLTRSGYGHIAVVFESSVVLGSSLNLSFS